MRKLASSTSARLATSLKVIAVATVLGFVVLAAEQRLTRDISPEEMVVTETAPVFGASGTRPAQNNTASAVQAAPAAASDIDYFPSHSPAASGASAEPPPTF